MASCAATEVIQGSGANLPADYNYATPEAQKKMKAYLLKNWYDGGAKTGGIPIITLRRRNNGITYKTYRFLPSIDCEPVKSYLEVSPDLLKAVTANILEKEFDKKVLFYLVEIPSLERIQMCCVQDATSPEHRYRNWKSPESLKLYQDSLTL